MVIQQHLEYLKEFAVCPWSGRGTSAWITGPGIHTGEVSRVRFHRALCEPVRLRVGNTEIPLVTDHVLDTYLATRIGLTGKTVSTIEHLLAALYVLNHWTGFVIEVEGPEIPILDGSALGWYFALRDVPPEPMPAPITPSQETAAEVREGYVGLEPAKPDEPLRITVKVGFPHPKIGRQTWTGIRSDWVKLLEARTFGFSYMLDRLLSSGRGVGFDGYNAVVFDDETDDTNVPLRGKDEPVRHKALDLLGDLYLIGKPLHAHVVADGASHEAHVKFANLIRHG
ncbi:MAG: UDP-3-O-acyl-N-acetylglucosamine deacetylase [Deinococcales bacterium]